MGEKYSEQDNAVIQSDSQQQVIDHLTAKVEALEKDLHREDISHANTIDQRDRAEAAADWLAQAVMGITGQDVGEHSNANCPWANGIEMAHNYAGEREKYRIRISRLEEALNQALIHWGCLGVRPEDGAAYAECEKRLEESVEAAMGSASSA